MTDKWLLFQFSLQVYITLILRSDQLITEERVLKPVCIL